MLAIGILSLHRGSDAKNLSLDGRAQVLGEEVRLFEGFPACGGLPRGLYRNLPEGACRNSCLVGEATHLIGRDFRKTAAATETQGAPLVWNVVERGHHI